MTCVAIKVQVPVIDSGGMFKHWTNLQKLDTAITCMDS